MYSSSIAIYFQAANEVLTQFLPTLIFRTAKDFVFTGLKIWSSVSYFMVARLGV